VWSGFQQDAAKRLGDVKRNSFRDALLMLAVAMPLASCGHAGLLDDGGLRSADLGADRSGTMAIRPAGGNADLARQQRIGDELAQRALGMMTRSQDTELEDYLNLIVNRLQATAEHGVSGLFYRVYLIDSPHANAFTPGGGHIFVTTGIIRRLRTEAQLAMVLAHEMAHNRATHVVKGQDGQSLNKRVTAFGKRIFDDKLGVPWLSKGVKALADTSLSSYTRAQEEEADRIGFQYFVAAGYDPREAPRSFAALIEVDAQKKSIFDVFDGYPEGIKRAEAINGLVFARYGERDTSHLTRNTSSYMRLAQAYWQ
jgi:predicted Zn-dependent protease